MSPDEIRRSWDDDDTPRSAFPEPLAERLTRENKELRAEVERLRRCGAEHPTNPSVVACTLDHDDHADGLHWSSTGCAGSAMSWPNAEDVERRAIDAGILRRNWRDIATRKEDDRD